MPRSRIDLSPYKDQIISDHQAGVTIEEIRQNLPISIGRAALYRYLRQWGCNLRYYTRANGEDDEAGDEARLHRLITGFVLEDSLSDQQILPLLSREGYPISGRTLRRIRMKLGLRRRTDDPKEQERQAGELRQIITKI